jgi:tRNA-dihydrouridine synthase B
MAQAAQINAEAGAEIIDINMGCPAKKVCHTLAGSALLRDEALVAQILQAVVKSVKIPVTLKIRTGWDPQHRNGVRIAQIAEDCGIQALSVHGRTRNCFYMGDAEYDTIAQIKSAVKIPIIANGDITSPEKAAYVLEKTQADGVMIGRAAQGKPWIFREIHHYLTTGQHLAPPTAQEVHTLLREHTQRVYDFYGEKTGVLIARKHVSWYSKGHVQGARFREVFNKLDSIEAQQALMDAFFTGIFL